MIQQRLGNVLITCINRHICVFYNYKTGNGSQSFDSLGPKKYKISPDYNFQVDVKKFWK